MSIGLPPEPPPPDPLGVEAVAAAIGARAFYSRELRRVHGYHLERAARLKADIDRKIYRFIQRDEPEKTAALPDFDYDEVAALLDAEQLPQHVQEQIAAFGEDGETALAVQIWAMKTQAYLKAKLPRRVHLSLAGPEYSRPPEIDIARFARTWAVACDPMIALDDLNEYAVSRDMVGALFDMFPTIAGTLLPAVQDALVRAKTVDQGFRLYRQKETLLRVLTRQEQPNIALGKAMQAMYATQAAAQKPQPPKGTPAKRDHDEGASSEATATQRLDA